MHRYHFLAKCIQSTTVATLTKQMDENRIVVISNLLFVILGEQLINYGYSYANLGNSDRMNMAALLAQCFGTEPNINSVRNDLFDCISTSMNVQNVPNIHIATYIPIMVLRFARLRALWNLGVEVIRTEPAHDIMSMEDIVGSVAVCANNIVSNCTSQQDALRYFITHWNTALNCPRDTNNSPVTSIQFHVYVPEDDVVVLDIVKLKMFYQPFDEFIMLNQQGLLGGRRGRTSKRQSSRKRRSSRRSRSSGVRRRRH
jgi:hypothetical protein